MHKVRTHLWYPDCAEEAVDYYIAVFKNGEITNKVVYERSGPNKDLRVPVIEFRLFDQDFIAINGGPLVTFNEAMSIYVECETQEEADEYWNALTTDGKESMCGWLKDKYGVSWQIVPKELTSLLTDPDPARAERATNAMLGMTRIDIGAIKKAMDS